jgi:hypothetical protein
MCLNDKEKRMAMPGVCVWQPRKRFQNQFVNLGLRLGTHGVGAFRGGLGVLIADSGSGLFFSWSGAAPGWAGKLASRIQHQAFTLLAGICPGKTTIWDEQHADLNLHTHG